MDVQKLEHVSEVGRSGGSGVGTAIQRDEDICQKVKGSRSEITPVSEAWISVEVRVRQWY